MSMLLVMVKEVDLTGEQVQMAKTVHIIEVPVGTIVYNAESEELMGS